MYEKKHYSINDIKIFDYKTTKRLNHFSCPECINRTQCRHHYTKRQTCDVCRDILSLNNIHLQGYVDGVIDSQFFILKNKSSTKTINDILKKYRRTQCQK